MKRRHVIDEQTFEEVYTRYRGVIYHRLYQMVHHPQLAEDLTQEVFYRAWKASPQRQAPLNIQPWLSRIATNLAIDSLRRQRLLAWSSLDQAAQEPEDERLGDPQTHFANRELVREALARLPVSYRQALLLRLEGYRLAEIAVQLGIAPSGMKMYLLRARHTFQHHYLLLQQEEAEPEAPDNVRI